MHCEKYECVCGNIYKYSQGLSKHKRKCQFTPAESKIVFALGTDVPVTSTSTSAIPYDLFVELMKQNTEFKEIIKEQHQQMMDQNKYIVENQCMQNRQMMELINKGIGNTTNTNSYNKTKNKFNLNFFLNEQCKDAMNITDFVDSIQLKLADLERVGEQGYVKGISHIVVNKLKDLDIYKRPIHCSDLKRETLYVKDQNVWERENDNHEKLTSMIQHLAHKNLKQLPKWQEVNPEYKDVESVKCDQYHHIISESMGGNTKDDDLANYHKIIKHISQVVPIGRESDLNPNQDMDISNIIL